MVILVFGWETACAYYHHHAAFYECPILEGFTTINLYKDDHVMAFCFYDIMRRGMDGHISFCTVARSRLLNDLAFGTVRASVVFISIGSCCKPAGYCLHGHMLGAHSTWHCTSIAK